MEPRRQTRSTPDRPGWRMTAGLNLAAWAAGLAWAGFMHFLLGESTALYGTVVLVLLVFTLVTMLERHLRGRDAR